MSPGRPRKICIVVASRANYARIKSVLAAVRDHPELELQLIASASALLVRFGNVVEVIEADGFRPKRRIHVIVEGENPTTMAKSSGLAVMEMATAFEDLRPDVVLTVADRFETMATAIAASYMNIILAHTQGGEVTGSIDESVRHAVTKLAQVHFPATEESKARLLRLGEREEDIHLTGCPSIDLLLEIGEESFRAEIFDHYGGVGSKLDPSKPYLVVMQHPVTTEYGRSFDQIQETLAAVVESGHQAVWFWPNVDAGSDDISKGLRMFRDRHPNAPIHFYRNMTPEDYARLIHHTVCLVGNSSSALREGAYLGVPAVNIGSRQSGRERASNVIDTGYDRGGILDAIRRQADHGRYSRSLLFGDGRAGERIADVLARCQPILQKRITY